jgi:protein tyrosine phosphatase (PTP) superfamily phosphohydrolase (DUF442 family)
VGYTAKGVLAATALSVGVAALAPILGSNLHTVVPGAVYRSAQLDPEKLATVAAELGLASILAVRAARPHKDWYVDEVRVARQLELPLTNIGFDPDRMPSRQQLRELVDQLDAAPRPLLLHCRAGVERSGLASAVVLLLEGASLASARDQFSLRFGFHPWLARSDLPRVINRYETWLEAQAIEHDPDAFRNWVDAAYIAGFYDATLEIVEFPETLRAGEAIQLALQVTNSSPDPMRFRETRDFGVHIGTQMASTGSAAFSHEGRAGARDVMLAPGASTVFEIDLGAVPEAGPYRLTIDLVDEGVVWFSEMGSSQLIREFRAELPAVSARGSR